jgi:hypothetical protein
MKGKSTFESQKIHDFRIGHRANATEPIRSNSRERTIESWKNQEDF